MGVEMASRQLSKLDSEFRASVKAMKAEFDRVTEEAVTLLIYCTHRPLREQAILYRQGRSLRSIRAKAAALRSQYGMEHEAEILLSVPPQYETQIVTYATPGQSPHNKTPALAIDAVPMKAGVALWGSRELYELYGRLARKHGMKWGGDWRGKKRDKPHVQILAFNWRQLIVEPPPA